MIKGWNYDFSGVVDGFHSVSALHIDGKKIASSEVLCDGVSREIVCISGGRVLTIGDIIEICISDSSVNLIRAGGVFSCMRGRLPIALNEYDSPAFFARPPLLGDKDSDSVGLFAVYQDGRRLLKQYYVWSFTNDTIKRIFRPVGEN